MSTMTNQSSPPTRLSISVLAVSSLQVILLVLVGSTGFILSIVSNLLPGRKAPLRNARSVSPKLQSASTSHTSSSSSSTSSREHLQKLRIPSPVRGDSGSLPELSLESSDDESEIGSVESEPMEVTMPALHTKNLPPLDTQLIPSTSSAPKSPTRCHEARRRSLDAVRHTLHIPPRSPPSSCGSSLASDEKHDSCRPKLARIFSSRKDTRPCLTSGLSEIAISDSSKPARRMSIKLSSFRSKGRRAASEVEIRPDNTELGLPLQTPSSSHPPPPTRRSASPPPSESVARTLSPASKSTSRSRRTASDYAGSLPTSLSRHQLMAEARKGLERDLTLVSLTRNAVDMSGKSELSMGQHFI